MAELALQRPYEVPKSGGSGRAIALAVVVHALLLGLLVFGIHWQSSAPDVIDAELWSATPQVAAPRPVPVPPQPVVAPPKPVPVPVPKVVEEPPKAKPDIAESVPPKKKEPPPKKEVVKVEAPKPVPKPQPVAKVEPPKTKEPPPKVEARTAPPKPVVEAPPRAPSELASLLASANSEGTGTAQQTSGPRGNQGYIAKLRNAIRSQMRYPGSASDNPVAKVRVEQLPNGEVVNVTIVKPSGLPAFDAAVERAVRAASPLPRPDNGSAEREFEFDYYLKDRG